MKEREIFDAALEIVDPDQRAAFLRAACGGDAELEDHLQGLLEAERGLGSFLEAPALGYLRTTTPPLMVERVGSTIGPYRLLEPIGEGGMGTVYMAEQTHPVHRRVALKVMKPGMDLDTKQVIARFETEHQALCLMDHPNIARVLDTGATGSGRPYFVMELVQGIPITEYCDRERLSIAERLELFILVCRAVQHAHQKGIIHRDLKPSNVLVTVTGGAAVPKVVDFGVARATGFRLTERTLFTGYHQFVGTPMYMSPEQAELSGIDVDTRSDVYALGVLLYELLTGTTPFDWETLARAAFDELRRILREEAPPRPSLRLSTLGDTVATVSANRRADPRQLGRALRGELDWIVMKTLQKNRERRYETASGLAADLRRYLDDEPVLACPPSALYRLGKLARRYKVALTTAALAAAVLVLAVVALAYGYVRLDREKQAMERALEQGTANEDETQQPRHQARMGLARARRIVDPRPTRVGEPSLLREPHRDGARKPLLDDPLAFSLEFLGPKGTDVEVRRETDLAYGRAAEINRQLGHDRDTNFPGDASTRLRSDAQAPGPSAGNPRIQPRPRPSQEPADASPSHSPGSSPHGNIRTLFTFGEISDPSHSGLGRPPAPQSLPVVVAAHRPLASHVMFGSHLRIFVNRFLDIREQRMLFSARASRRRLERRMEPPPDRRLAGAGCPRPLAIGGLWT